MDRITMIHGSGGRATSDLINNVFCAEFGSGALKPVEDAALVNGAERIAVTTDSFVVNPIFYPGGDIGRLAVCGTVNDLLTRGAVPKYITAGFILGEGTPIDDIRRVASSMSDTCRESGVSIVCGDTKVVESEGIYINTTGLGFVPDKIDISASGAKPGDVIIVSGNLGDHHAAIMSQRMEIENDIISDNAPLVEMAGAIRGYDIHSMRDVTRGGLATVLCELAEASGMTFTLDEKEIPISDAVRDFSGILGLDPLYMGNEGRMAVIVAKTCADEVLEAIRCSKYGKDAAIIGKVTKESDTGVFVRTDIGGLRMLAPLSDMGLPRIC